MKQNITKEQLEETSVKGKAKLENWMSSRGYWTITMFHLGPSIGQMIEFLDEYSNKNWKIDTEHHEDPVNCKDHLGLMEYSVRGDDDKGRFGFIAENEELCDALWEAVKQILEQEQ